MRRSVFRAQCWLLWHVAWSADDHVHGGDYEAAGRVGRYGSDANTIYFTPSVAPRGNYKQPTITCPYTLMGDTLTLRDCLYAGEYRR